MKCMKSALIVSFVFMLMFLPCSSSAAPVDNWHLRTSGTTTYLHGVAYGNGTFVAVGDGAILTSPDGVTWTDRTSPYIGWWHEGVAFGNGTFVIVGHEGQILTSPDGITWANKSLGYGSYKAVAYGDGAFIAVGLLGSGALIVKSTDNGETWIPKFSATTNELRGVAYCDGVACSYPTWAAVGENGIILTSLDGGETWGPPTPAIGIDLEGITVTQASMGGYYMPRLIAVGEGGIFVSSNDGWIPHSSGTTERLYGVTAYGHHFVAVGEIGLILDSNGGETWGKRQPAPYKRLFGVTYGNNTFVAVGIDGVILQSDPLSQDFDFNCDNQGWRALGLFDDLGLTPIPGWFVIVAAPWSSSDGDPAYGVIGVGSPAIVQFPVSPTGAPELHVDLWSPDLSSYTGWQGTTSFSYNVTGAWIITDHPISVAAALWVKKPDNSIAFFTDGVFHDIPTYTSGNWATHTVNVAALGIPPGSIITNVQLVVKFIPSSWVFGFVLVDHVVPTTAGYLSVTPSDGLTSSGNQGGPFSPPSKTYTLHNTGASSINWTASKVQAWTTLSSPSGTLGAGASTTVTVSINSTANSLAPGSYSDTVSFTNTTNGAGNTTRSVSLTVNALPGVLSVTPSDGLTSSGNQGGPFTPSSKVYTLQNTGGSSINWTASKGQTWDTLSSTSGTLGAGASTTVTVSINSNANSLAAGSYSDTVSFTNTTNGAGNTTRPVSLTVNAIPPVTSVTLTATPTSPQLVGTPVIFNASATGGVSPQYKFYWRDLSGVWHLGQNYSATSSWTWSTTGLAAGNYPIQVWARSAGSTASSEAVKTLSYTLTNPPVTSVTLTPTPSSPQPVGTPVIFNASATGGVSPQYKFYWRDLSGVWHLGQNYSATSSWTWSTTGLAAGNYPIQVWARSAGSTASSEAVKTLNYILN